MPQGISVSLNYHIFFFLPTQSTVQLLKYCFVPLAVVLKKKKKGKKPHKKQVLETACCSDG